MTDRFSDTENEVINEAATNLAKMSNERLIMQSLAELLGYFVEVEHRQDVPGKKNMMIAVACRALRAKMLQNGG